MWLYIPNVGKPIRITSLQSVTGGVFNNADIMRLDYAWNTTWDRSRSRTSYLLSSRPRPTRWPMTSSRCGWTRKPPAGQDRGLRGHRHVDQDPVLQGHQGLWRRHHGPAPIETDSPLYKGYKSVMLYSGSRSATLPMRSSPRALCRGWRSCASERRRGQRATGVAGLAEPAVALDWRIGPRGRIQLRCR